MAGASRRVAFLRAVNVGNRRTPMERLREEFEDLGFDEVSTYLNSGNVIFGAPGRSAALEATIEQRLGSAFGFEVTTFVRTRAEVAEIASRTPFGGKAGEAPGGHTHMVVLLKEELPAGVAGAVADLATDVDRLEVVDREVHWLITGKSLDSAIKPGAWKRALDGRPSTGRNLTMLTKLDARL